MITAKVDEKKYKLADVIAKQGASANAVAIFNQVVNQVDAVLRSQEKPVVFRTHVYGVTGFCNARKAFIFINLRKEFVAILCFTGKASIPGLAKANWLNKGDNKGSETIQVTDTPSIKKAVTYACAAYEIAVKS